MVKKKNPSRFNLNSVKQWVMNIKKGLINQRLHLGVAVLALIAIIICSWSKPFVLNIPPTTGFDQMNNWVGNIIPISIGLGSILMFISASERRRIRIIQIMIILLVLAYIICTVYVYISIYASWRSNLIGRYFINANLTWNMLTRYVKPFLFAGCAALLCHVFFRLLKWKTNGRVVGDLEIWSITLLALMIGIQRSVVMIFIAILLAILWSMSQQIQRRHSAIRLLLPMFIAAFIIIFFGNDIVFYLFD